MPSNIYCITLLASYYILFIVVSNGCQLFEYTGQNARTGTCEKSQKFLNKEMSVGPP